MESGKYRPTKPETHQTQASSLHKTLQEAMHWMKGTTARSRNDQIPGPQFHPVSSNYCAFCHLLKEFNKFITIVCMCSYVLGMSLSHNLCLEIIGQLVELVPFFYLYAGSRDQTHIARCGRQMPSVFGMHSCTVNTQSLELPVSVS